MCALFDMREIRAQVVCGVERDMDGSSKGAKNAKKCAKIACACDWCDMKKQWNLGMLESLPKTLGFKWVLKIQRFQRLRREN